MNMSDEEEDRKPAAREKGQPQSPRPIPPEFTVLNPAASSEWKALPLYRATSEPTAAFTSVASVGGRPRRTASPIPEARLPMRQEQGSTPPRRSVAKMPPQPADASIPRAATVGGGTTGPSASALLSPIEFEPKEWQKQKGWNPLHVAMCNRAEDWKVKLLLESEPAMSEEKNADGNTPLHEGLQTQSDFKTLTVLILKGGNAIRIPNSQGELPLHLACERNAPFRIIHDMVLAFPGAVKTQTYNYHQTPLHYLIRSKATTLPIVQLLLEACPEAAKIRDRYGRTPFMIAADNEAPREVLESLYEAFPAAAGMKPTEESSSLGFGSAPSHPSITAGNSRGGPRDVTRRGSPKPLPVPLAEKFLQGIAEGERIEEELKLYAPHGFRLRHNHNILHVALAKCAPLELIRFILECSPNMALEKTTEGNCPLLEGLASGASEESLNAVLDACELESCKSANNNNEFALHLAVRKSSPPLVLRILLANRDATMEQTLGEDEMPLHRLMVSPHSDDLVQDILSSFRKAAHVQDKFGRTPLHVAMNNRAPKDTIMVVFSAYPEALGIEDTQRRTPMDDSKFIDVLPQEFFDDMRREYKLACNKRNYVVNDVLLEYKPRNHFVNRGWNSLHVALSKGASPDRIEILLQTSPNMAKKRNDSGNFPLSEGLLGSADSLSLDDVLIAYPDACKVPNNDGEYALHHATFSDSTICENILTTFPDAINIASESSKSMPLHALVGQKERRVQIVDIKLLATEISIKARDANGDTPLHIAIKNKLRQSEIEYLLLEFVKGASIADNKGHLPLHSAIRIGLPEEILVALLEAYPDAVRMKYGDEGFLPLHLAMKYRSGSAFTTALISKNSKAPSIKTKSGFTPLSLALTYGADFGSVFTLLNLYRDAAKIRDSEQMVPLHIAMMKGAPRMIIMALISAYPDAISYVNSKGHTPFHSGIVPAVHVLQERYPDFFRPKEVRGGIALPPKSASHSELGKGRGPLADLLSILNNLQEMLENAREVAEQRDGSGNLPLLQFCMIFNPSVIRLHQSELREAATAITATLEAIYEAFPQAAEISGSFIGNPINLMVGECSLAKSVQQLLDNEASKRLRILLQNARDGRALQSLCNTDNKVSLWALFSLFDENDVLTVSSNSVEGTKVKQFTAQSQLVLDLNKEVIKGWCILDMLADFDTPASADILLQILREQKTKLDHNDETFQIVNEDLETLIGFKSSHAVSDILRTRIADRAKLVNASAELRTWGEAYGRFLKRYRLEKQPKHVSESCVVVFGTESVNENAGKVSEKPVALKFMCSRDTFLREVKKRPLNADGKTDHVIPIRKTFSSIRNDEFECTKVDLQAELEPYKDTIKLEGANIKYVIVMDCGAGYDLHDFISHQNVAGKDLMTVTTIAKEIALCLKYLNETCGIIHGDVKARNFVAKGVGKIGFAAIDLDNASSIGREPAGQKRTSSGYLPPEQANVEAYNRTGESSNGEQGAPVVIASSQYDMWCFGVLLYFLCTGKQLFNVDTKEDVDTEDLVRIRDWDNDWKKEKLSKVDAKWPRKLLDSLLQKDPTNRPENWSVVVDEMNRFGSSRDNAVYDRIVIFQSAPLVYTRKLDGQAIPLDQLDFNKESEMLRGALKDAERVGCTIDAILETGSPDRLQAFMAQQMSSVLHYSGHGTKDYMAWEDERGKLNPFREYQLRTQIEGIGSFLKCAFISACHSEWVAQAFVDAGVPHAICCPVDEMLQDIAACEFTRNFYRALACKKTIKQAFLTAKRAVIDSPFVSNAEVEAEKFLLLPDMPDDSDYHDVQIFYTSEVTPIPDESTRCTVIGVPRSRDLLEGRNVEKYSILCSLAPDDPTDVVRVFGDEGLGKTALVADVCRHIRLRPRSPPQLDYMFWFPPTSQVGTVDPFYECISSYIRLSIESREDDNEDHPQLLQLRHTIGEMENQKSLLLIFDLRKYERMFQVEAEKIFQKAIGRLLAMSKATYFKVVLIDEKHPTQAVDSNVREKPAPVYELEIEAAIRLFARRISDDLRRQYRVLNNRNVLVQRLLDPPEGITVNEKALKDREDEVWDQFLGRGKPGRCCDIARNIVSAEIENLLRNWWEIDPTAVPPPPPTDDDDDFPSFM